MTDERFNTLLEELIGGLPVTLVVTRLALALRYMVETPPDVGAELRLENFIAQQRDEEKAGESFPFEPIETGQPYPEGVGLRPGRCEQCGRSGPMATVRLQFGPITSPDKVCCAECLADFCMGGFGKVFVKTALGKFQQLAVEL